MEELVSLLSQITQLLRQVFLVVLGHSARGESNQAVLTTTGNSDIFIARYNPDGTLVWAKHAGGSSYSKGTGVTGLSDNSCIVTGWFFGTAIFAIGETSEIHLESSGNEDIFVARYNSDGSLAWAKSAGGLNGENNFNEHTFGITTLSDNSTVVTGVFAGPAIFGLGETNETQLIATGDTDIFIARFGP
jgi:hypothetical protein